MKHIKAINRKAVRIEGHARSARGQEGSEGEAKDVVALQNTPPGVHIPLGCSLVFAPGWEADISGGTAGLCQPVERDLFDCHYGCFWPVQVPDQLNHSPDWTGKCAAAQKDWRKIDLIFPVIASTSVRIGVGVVLVAGVLATASANLHAQSDVSGGDGTIYITTYAHEMLVMDERTYEIVDRIQTQAGIPGDMLLNSNRERFYVVDATGEHVEVFDIAARESIDQFTLSGGARQFRISGLQVDPSDSYAIIAGKNATKRIDRWEIGPSLLLRYDLETKRVTDTIPWPDDHERERGVNVQFSPDGSLLYFYAQDVVVLETENFTEVDRWEISRPLEPGLGRAGLGFQPNLYEEPGFYTGLFRVTDPVQNRRMMGVARVNLAEKSVDFYTLGPSQPVRGLALAPDLKKAYSLYSAIGRYEFWTFDLENRSVSKREEFAGRPRMDLSVSSSGEFLYITNAGRTIEVHDAETYEHLRTVEIDADMTDFQLLPPPGSQ